MKHYSTCSLVACGLLCPAVVVADTADIEAMNKKLEDYERRLQALEVEDGKTPVNPGEAVTSNAFNPAISVIFDGVYASYDNHPEDYTLAGFAPVAESEPAPAGFSLGHAEMTLSNNIDDKFFGQFTLAVAEHENEIEVELEEAYFETLGLGGGFSLRGGRFYSAIGYLNQQHEHAWDFHDAPLIYRGLFGKHYFDDGVRISYVAPTDLYLELGVEAFAGRKPPAGGEHDGVGSWLAYISAGGDIGYSQSWQAGASYWSADNIEREQGAHGHGGVEEIPLFEGDSEIFGVNAVYKWAPHGNYRDQHFKLQFEYLARDENGTLTLLNSAPLETGTLDAQQDGWYLQARWQYLPSWAAALRYDALDSDIDGSEPDVLDEAGLLAEGHQPQRSSVALEWLPSEFSRVRLQLSRDESSARADDQLFLQYTFSMGAHGAHAY